jgi:hypothetical protein
VTLQELEKFIKRNYKEWPPSAKKAINALMELLAESHKDILTMVEDVKYLTDQLDHIRDGVDRMSDFYGGRDE